MNKRNTIQRSLTLAAVQALQCHATAEEVYAQVAKAYPAISRATVYRNLNQLAESGDILKLEIPEGADRFDHQCHPHYHARCLACGQVMDVDMAYIPDLEARIGNTQGFQCSGYDLMFKGLCAQCAQAKDPAKETYAGVQTACKE